MREMGFRRYEPGLLGSVLTRRRVALRLPCLSRYGNGGALLAARGALRRCRQRWVSFGTTVRLRPYANGYGGALSTVLSTHCSNVP